MENPLERASLCPMTASSNPYQAEYNNVSVAIRRCSYLKAYMNFLEKVIKLLLIIPIVTIKINPLVLLSFTGQGSLPTCFSTLLIPNKPKQGSLALLNTWKTVHFAGHERSSGTFWRISS